MDDWQLIREFVDRGSQEAFSALARRHVDLVYSAAKRQVRDAELAQDVVQAVFIVLAAKAGSLQEGVLLSAWLFKTTRFAANNALKMKRRREHHEQQAAAERPEQIRATEEIWSEVTPQLDSAIASLNEADRDAILLRYFENRPLAQIGMKLGVSADAAEKRVSRAVEKLRVFLMRGGKGATLSLVVLGGLLASNAVMAAPVGVLAVPASENVMKIAQATMKEMRGGVFAFRWSVVAAILLITAGVISFLVFSVTVATPPGRRVVQVNDGTGAIVVSANGAFAEVRRLAAHPAGAYAVAFAATGELVTASPGPITVGSYGAPKGEPSLIRFFNPASGAEVRRLSVDTSPISALAISADNTLFAYAGGDDAAGLVIHVRDVRSNRSVFEIKGRSGAITALAFVDGSKRLVSAGANRTLRVWEMENGEPIKQLARSDGTITALAAAGKLLGYLDGESVRVIKVDSGEVAVEIAAKNACAIALNGAGELLWADGELHVYNLKARKEVSKKALPLVGGRNLAIGAGGGQLLTTAGDDTVRLFVAKEKK